MWHYVLSNDLIVNNFSAASLWVIQPENKSGFLVVVHRNPVRNRRDDAFENRNTRKDYPVRQPLGNALGDAALGSFHRLKRHVRGVHKAQQVRNQFEAANEPYEEENDQQSTSKEVNLGISGLFFQLFELLCRDNNSQEKRVAC